MNLFLFIGSRRGFAVLKRLLDHGASIGGILCLIEDAHEEAFHPRVTALATQHQIPIFYSNEVKPSGYADVLRNIQPDIAFAAGWRHLIPKDAWVVPPKGTLILHDSLLPRYRGFAPMNWAIINGETETGVTLFYIAEEVDAGPIVDQLVAPVSLQDNARTVDERIISLYEEIIVKNLPALQAGTAKAVPQDESFASYTCKRTPEDGEIDWRQSSLAIHNLVRGLTHPFPGAYTSLRGRRLFVWEAALSDRNQHYVGSIPGRLIGRHNGRIEVLTGQGVLSLVRVQFEGAAECDAAEIPISVKDTLGR